MKLWILSVAIAVQAVPVAAQSQTDPQAAQARPGEAVGGYQPAHPPLNGLVRPGTHVIYQQAPSPAEAYPASPPLSHYPYCKRGQTDHCTQRGG